jgi:NADH-quinone oxidoreductase subunit E
VYRAGLPDGVELMSVRRLAAEQPADFAFTPENLEWAQGQIAKYPEGRQASAVIALLWKAQEQHGGWLPEPAIRATADLLGMAYIRVLEVATFYTMFSLEPVGRHFVQVCGTTPCLLRGADKLRAVCERVIGPEKQITEDGQLSWLEVECLGACANAPMVQVNFDYFEDLNPESFEKLLEDLRADRPVKPGPQVERAGSAPVGGPTTLTDPSLYDGSCVGSWKARFNGAAANGGPVADEAAKPKTPSPGEKEASRGAEKPAAKAEEKGASMREDTADLTPTPPDGAKGLTEPSDAPAKPKRTRKKDAE